MRKRITLVSAMTFVALLLIMVSATSASKLSLGATPLVAAWPELSFETAAETVTCAIGLSGSFHSSTFRKTSRALIGHITDAEGGRCEGSGTVTILRETLPWHLAYNGFTGTLPRLSGVRLLLIGASFRISNGIACLATTDTSEPVGATALVEANGVVTGIDADPAFEIDIDSPDFACSLAGDVQLSGRGIVAAAADFWDWFLPKVLGGGDGFGDLNAANPDTDLYDDARRHQLRLI